MTPKFLNRLEYPKPTNASVDWDSVASMLAGEEWAYQQVRRRRLRDGLSFFFSIAQAVAMEQVFKRDGLYPVWGGR